MRFLFNLFLLVIILLSTVGLPQAQEESNDVPIMEIEESVHDFGVVPEGEVVNHEYTIYNRGTAVLEIQKIEPD